MSKMPTFSLLMLPLLKLSSDQKEHSLRESIINLADQLKLSQEERDKTLSDGRSVLYIRVSWAKTYLMQAGLIESTERGIFKITKSGLELLDKKPEKIDDNLLEEYAGFREFKQRKKKKAKDSENSVEENSEETNVIEQTLAPDEAMDEGIEYYNKKVADELLTSLYEVSPVQFEQIVVDLLVKMGYGGSRKEAGQVLGKSGDEGIDGVIKEDKLGLDAIYIQAKRWTGNTVGRPDIQQFVGALSGKKARKGVYITTSKYSREAFDYVKHLEQKVILIDGQNLVELMLEYNLGVSTERVIEIKKIDSDYFNEE